MSFNTDVKNEVLLEWQKSKCCRLCECLGFLLFCTEFDDSIYLKTQSEQTAIRFKKIIKKNTDIDAEIEFVGRRYIVRIPDDKVAFLHNNFGLEFADKLFKCDKCYGAFLIGAYLAGGSISDPKKEYRAEFLCKSEDSSILLYRTLFRFGLHPKMTIKNKKVCVYLKDSESIEDLLTLMNAVKSSLNLMNMQIIKDIRNNTNRKTNFETANLKKSSTSSAIQLNAIEIIEKNGKFQALDEDLQKIALARKENLDMSLSELGDLFGLSRSGIHHKFKKIIDYSKTLGV